MGTLALASLRQAVRKIGLLAASGSRKGTNEVNTNGVTANLVFFQRDFLGAPVNQFLSSQKCQGVPFFPSCQN